MLIFISFLTLAQAYVLKWMIPVYEMLDGKKAAVLAGFIERVYVSGYFGRDFGGDWG